MEIDKKIVSEATVLAKDVYQDVAKPALSEVGKTAGGLTRVLLAPLNGIVWGFDKIIEKLDQEVSAKLSKVPRERYQTPPAFIAGPAVEALRYTAEVEDIRNLYNNLIANAMDSDTVANVHPSFVDIIKNINSDEANLLKAFIMDDSIAYIEIRRFNTPVVRSFSTIDKYHTHIVEDFNLKLQNQCKLHTYLDNLTRIGLISTTEGYSLDDDRYISLENCENVIKLKKEAEGEGARVDFRRSFFRLTSFGSDFIRMVVSDK
ncbi:DUF4393 domain-containing protein [Sphingobacterium multivorum]|uniref:DUF4393 domain-containing protein n=1 Tax=Sphingobacterium multivorum TaxID=28454 RepID=UPI00191A68EF|nr:DUF4393 domain-containing protein [Sphingobacterium multivorum]QQT61008.1 DUF4393 domain-containing protein [Sphingobacterium multivorum]